MIHSLVASASRPPPPRWFHLYPLGFVCRIQVYLQKKDETFLRDSAGLIKWNEKGWMNEEGDSLCKGTAVTTGQWIGRSQREMNRMPVTHHLLVASVSPFRPAFISVPFTHLASTRQPKVTNQRLQPAGIDADKFRFSFQRDASLRDPPTDSKRRWGPGGRSRHKVMTKGNGMERPND